MSVFRCAGVAVAMAVAGLCACGEDTQSLFGPASSRRAGHAGGHWEAASQVGYRLRYVFHRDGTYSHASGIRGRRESGRYRYAIRARGRSAVRGRTLALTPRRGTIERRDPDDPSGDFKRPVGKKVQRYGWSVRGTGDGGRLRLTIGGGLAIAYRRR